MRTAQDVNAVAEGGFAFRLAKIGPIRAIDYQSTKNHRYSGDRRLADFNCIILDQSRTY